MAKAKRRGFERPARDRAGLGRHVGLTGSRPPYALEAAEVVPAMGSDETVGLSPAEASARRARYGENNVDEAGGEVSPKV